MNPGSEKSNYHEVPISKAQKRAVIEQVQGKSNKEAEKLLSSTFPEICNEKEKVRNIGNNKVEIKIILDKGSQQKLEDLKKLLSHQNPNMSYGELFSLLAELGLNKFSPKRKINKKNNWILASAGMTKNTPKRKPEKTSAQKTTRYIPSVVRHHVWMRDQGQCTYVCPKTKRKCSSNHLLQIDHIKPLEGSTSDPSSFSMSSALLNLKARLRGFQGNK